jgi:predicted ferric reductase
LYEECFMTRSITLSLGRIASIGAYGTAVLAPTILIYSTGTGEEQRTLLLQVALVSSLIAYPMLALQPVLSARLKWLDRLFGLDKILVFHKAMAVVSGVLVLIHPTALALNLMDPFIITSLYAPWYIQFGKLGLLILLCLLFTSLLRRAVHLTYERWRWLHNLLALLLLAVGIIHALLSGRDMSSALLQAIFFALLALGIGSYAVHKVIGPARRKKHPFHVSDIARENIRVWTVTFKPSPSAAPMRHLPGQFQFITPHGGELREEEHPFTISSCTTESGHHSSTIKESGDFTSYIGRIRPGDWVAVQGPFGRFSYLLHPRETDLVFIAGGIGVTPFMSMLRHMASTARETPVLLLYANRTEEDIAFAQELDRLARGKTPGLSVVHVLESPPEGWGQETGRITGDVLERNLDGGIRNKAFYICGPPPMMRSVIDILRHLRVPRRRVHWERFSL